MAACGGDGETVMEPEPVITPPTAPLSGRILVADSFAVPVTQTNFQVTPYTSGGTLPQDIGSTAGNLLVLSITDISRPDIVCTGGIGASNCAIMIALPRRDEGFVSAALASGRQNFYLQSTARLDLEPEPACPAYLVGGTVLQWSTTLVEDLEPGSFVQVSVSMRKLGEPSVVIGWELILVEPGGTGQARAETITTNC